ncbi:MAG: hypothetical protein AAB922_01435 [Patescibacteria group bacterium]
MKKEQIDKLIDAGFSAVHNGTLTIGQAARMVKEGIHGEEEIIADIGNLFMCKECREKNRDIVSLKYKFF